MECISRYKAVFGVFTLLAMLVLVYIYTVGNEAVTPTTLAFKPWRSQRGAQRMYNAIVQRTNKTVFIPEKEAQNTHPIPTDIKTSLPKYEFPPLNRTSLSEFGWIKNVSFTRNPRTKAEKESEISEENILLPPSKSKSKVNRRIAQLNLETDSTGSSFLTDLPDLPKPEEGKYLIYLCDDRYRCGGLGDRERGIMGVFLLALVTRRRFGVRIKSPCDFDNFFAPNKINWTVGDHVMKNPFTDYIDGMDNLLFKRSLIEGNFNRHHMEDVLFVRSNVDFASTIVKVTRYKRILPKWAKSGVKSLVFHNMWNLLFKPSRHLEARMNVLRKEMDQSAYSKLVCAHVRLGKNPTIPGDETTINSLTSVFVLWEFMKSYGPDAYHFIATDAEIVRDIARREFKSRLLMVDGVILHIDRQRKADEACDGFETALLEQNILSRCDVLIVSQSGFSILAAFMRGSDKELYKFDGGKIIPSTMEDLPVHS